ncbi:MAG: periplasmic heavy metal sensor [Bilophila sp.]
MMHTFLKTTFLLFAVSTFVCTGSALVAAKDTPAQNATQADTATRTPPCGCTLSAPAMTPEKQARYEAVVKEAEAKMAPLQEQMLAKGIELQALTQTPQTDRPAIAALAKDMAALHQKLVEVHDQMTETLAKETGVVAMRKNAVGCGMGCGLSREARHGRNHQGNNMMGLMPIMPAN